MITKLSDLDFGIYQDARSSARHGRAYVDLNGFLADEAQKGGVSEALVRFGKDAPRDRRGRTVSPVRQMLVHSGIRLDGPSASSCAVFMRDKEEYVKGAEVLFPALTQEWFERSLGILAADGFYSSPGEPGDTVYPTLLRPGVIDETTDYPPEQVTLEQLVSLTLGINEDSYKTAVIKQEVRDGLEMGRVAEAADLPLYTLETAEQSVRVYKFGGRIRASYESLRRMRINKVQRLIADMAWVERQRLIREALLVAVNGDGNANPALDTTGPAEWTIEALNEWVREIAYEHSRGINIAVGDFEETIAVENLRYPSANLQLTPEQLAMYGTAPRLPNGAMLRQAPKDSILEDAEKLLAWNTALALEQVIENGSQINESERFITNQTNEWTMSINTGFAKPYSNSFFTITRETS